jgi:cobalamin biosynthesis protein CbiG
MDVSSTLLADKKVYFRSDVRVEGTPPAELKLIDSTAFDTNPETSDLGIHVTACQVSGNLLQLIPQNIYIGIGCKRGTASAVIAASVDAALNQSGLDVRSVAGVATISLKANEPGLLDFCKKQNWTLDIYTAEELMAAPGLFEASEFVLKTTGADNVCERAASLASGNGKCLFNKYGQNGVTVAIYQQETTVRFGS